jgi:hypothetical protein
MTGGWPGAKLPNVSGNVAFWYPFTIGGKVSAGPKKHEGNVQVVARHTSDEPHEKGNPGLKSYTKGVDGGGGQAESVIGTDGGFVNSSSARTKLRPSHFCTCLRWEGSGRSGPSRRSRGRAG